jgi:nicotinamide riboside kinase
LASQANRWMMEDSHPLTTSVWAEYLGFPNLSKRIDEWCTQQKPPQHIFLANPQLTDWVPDVHRNKQTDREWFFTKFQEKMDNLGWNYEVLSGNWNERTLQAENSLHQLIRMWKTQPLEDWVSGGTKKIQIGLKF